MIQPRLISGRGGKTGLPKKDSISRKRQLKPARGKIQFTNPSCPAIMLYFPELLEYAEFIALIPPILIFWWLISTSTPWRRRKHLWRKLKQLLFREDQP
ncbi:MAG: hypothetical protein F4X14_15590 [Caldilineaceae bacterium SB0661_bin_32]|uniref:Uncharacterized protein n=1 Tax=Caldilineaceae bacterium SB0661_bin_32 TaxID=2605255 RepID=A0A6B1D9V5_9CHLR|nr:hypothetical protein [Caldilineaceae bacterium SB0661_bin_32]